MVLSNIPTGKDFTRPLSQDCNWQIFFIIYEQKYKRQIYQMQWILNFNCHFLLLSISPRHFTLHLEFILCISDVDFTWIFYDTNLNPDPDNILIACSVYNVQCTSWTGNLSYFPLGKISASRERENLSRPTTARLAAVMERHTLYTGTATDMVCYIHRHCLIYIISHIDIFAHKYIWYYIYIFTRPTQKIEHPGSSSRVKTNYETERNIEMYVLRVYYPSLFYHYQHIIFI